MKHYIKISIFLTLVFVIELTAGPTASYRTITIDSKSFAAMQDNRPVLADHYSDIPEINTTETMPPLIPVTLPGTNEDDSGMFIIRFSKQVRNLFIWRDDIPTGRMYYTVGQTLIDYNEKGHYHLFCILQDTLESIPRYYSILQRDIKLDDTTTINIDHDSATLQADNKHYHQSGSLIEPTTIYKNWLRIYWAHVYSRYSLPFSANFMINDTDFIFYTNMLDEEFSLDHNKIYYDTDRDKITFLNHYKQGINSTQDLLFKDGPNHLHTYNARQTLNNETNQYIRLGQIVYHERPYYFSSHSVNFSIFTPDNQPFSGILELADTDSLKDQNGTIITAYRFGIGGIDSITNEPVLAYGPNMQVQPDGTIQEVKEKKYTSSGSLSEMFANKIKLNTYRPNDTLKIQNDPANVLFPVLKIVKSDNLSFNIYYNGDAKAGLECVNGEYEHQISFNTQTRFTNMRVYTENQQIDHKVINTQPVFFRYDFPTNANKAYTFQITSSPYHILGQYGFSQIQHDGSWYEKKLPCLYHMDIRSNNRITPHLKPGNSNEINIHLHDAELFPKRSMQISNADTVITLSLQYLNTVQAKVVLPDDLPTGYYDLALNVHNNNLKGFRFTASPAFYYAPEDIIPVPGMSLHVMDYQTLNNNTLRPNVIDNLTLSLKNIGPISAKNIHITSPDSGSIRVMQQDSISVLIPGAEADLHIPIMLENSNVLTTPYTANMKLVCELNEQIETQSIQLVFGISDITNSIDTPGELKVSEDFNLIGSYPNPVNLTNGKGCTFQIQLGKTTPVRIDIYNILGQHVYSINKQLNAGIHHIQWNGTDISNNLINNGVYLYTIQANNSRINGKILVIE